METFLIENNKCGIYCIVNIISKNKYIGSSVNIGRRLWYHLNDLKKNKHHSLPLQRGYNKYGKENFHCEILEFVDDKQELISKEQKWMESLNPKYNTCSVAYSKIGVKHSEETKLKMRKPKSDATKIKMSIYAKERKEGHNEKISQSMTGKPKSEETKAKLRKFYLENPKKGYKMTEKQNKRNSDSQKGKKLSEITKEKIRIKMIGRIVPIESVEKSRLGRTGKTHNVKKVVLNLETGIFYKNVDEAYKSYSKYGFLKFRNKLKGRIENNTSYIYLN